ncbi:hypothetical protein [Granulicatella seriolae]|uniref:Uncharacterized protein n=1 Tax=Granulicatella seriolae TaxID=2967226 RepID=A0ABT1WQE7_9LACT|nr:hypothetical protein [Granulicatella seriolae]
MKNNVCKKCQKPLPEGYKHKKCESCRNAKAQDIKKGIQAAMGVASTVVGIVFVIAKQGKNKL